MKMGPETKALVPSEMAKGAEEYDAQSGSSLLPAAAHLSPSVEVAPWYARQIGGRRPEDRRGGGDVLSMKCASTEGVWFSRLM